MTAEAASAVSHLPVLLEAVLAALDPQPGQTIIDGTFGAGGYTKALLGRGASVIGIDRDPDAIAAGRRLETAFEGRLRLVERPFSELDMVSEQRVDGVVLDIGVSSMQLDQPGRGFSFRADGPLDMRMAQSGPTAASVVNTFKAGDLARILNFLGEERQAGRIARALERRRAVRAFERTKDLAETIEATIGRAPQDKIHPATRAFQALRIYVNDELGELARAQEAAERVLKPGGRLVVVTFHSLEDRIVKRFLTDRSSNAAGSRHLPEVNALAPTFDKPDRMIGASDAEATRNPRARSAKLRAATRTAAPARASDLSSFGLPTLPSITAAEG